MRLIDADVLWQAMMSVRVFHANTSREESLLRRCEQLVDNAPTVEAKPVVHGKWVHGYNCSECGLSYMDYADADSYPASGNPLPNFCGNCGADMRKKVE